jgi:hypothetical protein
MNKAKLMISFLAIGAILTITFAFKAQYFSSHFIYTGKLGSGSCTTKVKGAAIMSGSPNVAASTVSVTKGCPDVFTIAIDD